MNISLSPDVEQFIQMEIGSGIYKNANEVIRAGLRRLRDEQRGKLPTLPESEEELESQLLAAIERLDNGGGVDGEAFMKRLIAEARAATRDA